MELESIKIGEKKDDKKAEEDDEESPEKTAIKKAAKSVKAKFAKKNGGK